jgi:large subunit ribosomal protein L14
MKSLKVRMTKGLNVGSYVNTCDNSGAALLFINSVKRAKTVKGRIPSAGIADMVMASVKKGTPDMRKTVVPAIIVRQRREFKRPDGTRIKFEDNAAVVLKDDKGNPKGTMIKGPIAKEVADRWPAVAKIAKIIV